MQCKNKQLTDIKEENFELNQNLSAIMETFSQKSFEEMNCELVYTIYNQIINIYKHPLAGIMGVYELGKLHK